MTDRATWEKLGVLLRARRVDGLGYKSRPRFAQDRNIHERTARNLENATRSSYARGTLFLADKAYGLEAGSCAAFLAGGELTEIPDAGLLDGLSAGDQETVREYVAALIALRAAEERKRRSG